MLPFGLHNHRAIGKIVEKLSETELVTSLLTTSKHSQSRFEVEVSKIEQKTMVSCSAINCSNNYNFDDSTFKFLKIKSYEGEF